jgi:hypothetical protein
VADIGSLYSFKAIKCAANSQLIVTVGSTKKHADGLQLRLAATILLNDTVTLGIHPIVPSMRVNDATSRFWPYNSMP